MLEWDWLKDVCALGVETAASTGRWAAMATGNFKYHGMWRCGLASETDRPD